MSNPKYEGGPPDAVAIEIARVIDKGIRESKTIDNQKLCIKAGEQVWSVSVDICPINDDGNLLDVGSIAAMAAILNARFPSFDGEKVDYKQKTTEPLPLSKVPLAITVIKIGSHLIVDPTESEEKVLDARLTVISMEDGKLCALQKGGDTPLTIEEIGQMVDLAMTKANEIRKLIKES